MIITIFYSNALQVAGFVFYLVNFFNVAVTAPFILVVFGFRGSCRTALMGMATGILFSLAWDKWVRSTIGVYCGVFSTISNGLAMMAAHYLLPQPPGKGWVGLDDQQKRMQQLIRAFKKYKKRIDLE